MWRQTPQKTLTIQFPVLARTANLPQRRQAEEVTGIVWGTKCSVLDAPLKGDNLTSLVIQNVWTGITWNYTMDEIEPKVKVRRANSNMICTNVCSLYKIYSVSAFPQVWITDPSQTKSDIFWPAPCILGSDLERRETCVSFFSALGFTKKIQLSCGRHGAAGLVEEDEEGLSNASLSQVVGSIAYQ